MGYQRKVKEEVTITCDRCGCQIVKDPDYLAHIGYFRLLKWCIPSGMAYKRTYLCGSCWDGLKGYLYEFDEERG